MTTVTSLLLALALLTLLAAPLLAAVDAVLADLEVVRALRLVDDERRGAGALLWLVEHRARSRTTVLALAVVARMLLAVATTLLAVEAGAAPVVLAAVVAAVVIVSLVLGEVAPRTLAQRRLEATGLALAPATRTVVRVLGPVARGLALLGGALAPRRRRTAGSEPGEDEPQATDDADDAQDEEIEPEERAMIHSILELGDTVVREIMVPRPDVVFVDEGDGLHEVVQVALDRGVSRLPVRGREDAQGVVGMVHIKDLLRRLATEPGHTRWADLVRPATFVPETRRCDDLLRDLQAAVVHLALVVDEHGELVGLVTIEDVLEEIVGEIVDEHDRQEPLVERLGDGQLRVDGRLAVDDLNELLGCSLPEDGWDTVGGLVVASLGRVPDPGEQLELEGTAFTVEQVQGRRVGKVLVRAATASTAEAS